MMYKLPVILIIHFTFLGIFSNLIAQPSASSGITVSTGTIYTENLPEEITLNKEIVRLDGFYQKLLGDLRLLSLAHYNVRMQMTNTTENYKNVQCILPLTFYFTAFGKSNRS